MADNDAAVQDAAPAGDSTEDKAETEQGKVAAKPAKPTKAKATKKDTKKKPPAAKKAKKPATHPKYSDMIKEALGSLKERGGSSRQAILKFIVNKYSTGHDEKTINLHLKMALRAGVKNGALSQSKGTGASGSFKLGEKGSPAPKKATKSKVRKEKKPKAEKVKKVVASKPKKTTKSAPKKTKTAAKSKPTKKPKGAAAKKGVNAKKAK